MIKHEIISKYSTLYTVYAELGKMVHQKNITNFTHNIKHPKYTIFRIYGIHYENELTVMCCIKNNNSLKFDYSQKININEFCKESVEQILDVNNSVMVIYDELKKLKIQISDMLTGKKIETDNRSILSVIKNIDFTQAVPRLLAVSVSGNPLSFSLDEVTLYD